MGSSAFVEFLNLPAIPGFQSFDLLESAFVLPTASLSMNPR